MSPIRIVAAALAAALLATPAGAQGTKVAIGISGWTGFAPLTLAKEAGIFAKNGLDVTIKKIPQASRHLAIASGDIQCAATTVETWIVWNANGVATTQLFQMDKSYGADDMVVRNDLDRFHLAEDVIDLSDQAHDPLSLLLEVRVGGGTHIAKALRHARTLVTVPRRTMVVVVSDFEEGHPLAELLDEVRVLAESGCRLLGCASLDDRARPRYAVGIAQQLVAAGMPVAALSPVELARWVADQVR